MRHTLHETSSDFADVVVQTAGVVLGMDVALETRAVVNTGVAVETEVVLVFDRVVKNAYVAEIDAFTCFCLVCTVVAHGD